MRPHHFVVAAFVCTCAFFGGLVFGMSAERDEAARDRWRSECRAAGGFPRWRSADGWRCYRSLDTLHVATPTPEAP